MTKARTLVTDALIEHGIVGAGEEPQPEDSAFCLRKLNQIIQRMSNSRLAFPVLTEISIPLDGSQEYTVGPTGTVSAARPVKVQSLSATDAAGIEWPVNLITAVDWGDIAYKNVSGGPPSDVWYEATNTDGVFHVYPMASGYTLKVSCQTLLASFASLDSDLLLPEGYETWLTLQLADDIAPAFAKQTTPDIMRRLRAASSAIKASNAEPLYLDTGMGAGSPYLIRRGT